MLYRLVESETLGWEESFILWPMSAKACYDIFLIFINDREADHPFFYKVVNEDYILSTLKP